MVAVQLGMPLGAAGADEESGRAVIAEAVYVADLWRNTTGGIEPGNAYLDELDLKLAIDGERALGVSGLGFLLYGMYTNGGSLSGELVGDAMGISNIESPRAWRLHEAWAEWRPGGGTALSLRAGIYDLGLEFDGSETHGLFLQGTHGVGHDLAQSGTNGPSIFPATGLGARVAWRPPGRWQLLAAAVDGAPADADASPRERLRLSSGEGALLIAELQRQGDRFTSIAIGAWQYTAGFTDLARPDAGDSRHDNNGIYGFVDARLRGLEGDAAPGVSAYARYGTAEGRINEFDRFFALGLRGRGLVAGRADDELGLGVAIAGVSGAAQRAALAAGEHRDDYEASIELTWRAEVTRWLSIQPDVHYVLNPGTYRPARDALVLGIRLQMARAWPR